MLDFEGWFGVGVGDADAGYWDAVLFAEAAELDGVFAVQGNHYLGLEPGL